MAVTIKSYRKAVEAAIMKFLEDRMVEVKVIVQRQAMQNLSQSPPSHPQRQTGQLISNVAEYSHIEKEGNKITAVIGTNIKKPPYPHYLEFGIPGGRQPPYPWLFPAVEASRDKIIKALKGAYTFD